MTTMASQITSLTVVYSIVYSGADQKTSKLRITGLCAGNSPGPVNSRHKGPVTRKMFPFDDVIMNHLQIGCLYCITVLLCRDPPMTGGFPSQSVRCAERVSIACRRVFGMVIWLLLFIRVTGSSIFYRVTRWGVCLCVWCKIVPGGRLNKKDGLTRYGDSHVKDKTS